MWAVCNGPQMRIDRLGQTSSDIKGYTDFSSFSSFSSFDLIPVKMFSAAGCVQPPHHVSWAEGEERAHLIFDLFVCLGNEIFCGAVSVAVWYFAS